jgi:hypothetical protein
MKKRPSQPTTQPSAKPLARPSPFKFANTDLPNTGKFFLIYGDPGEGKTTVAAQFPKPLFIITAGETGIDSAKRVGVAAKDIPVVRLDPLYPVDDIPAGTGHPGFEAIVSTLNSFAAGGHDRRTVVIDTLSGVERIVEQHCASIEFNGNMAGREKDEWNSYGSGVIRTEAYWNSEFLAACQRCVVAGYNVVLLAHCAIIDVKHPSLPDFKKYQPDMGKRIFNTTNKVVQYVFFFGRQPEYATDKKTKKQSVTSMDRFVGIAAETWYTAKNWDNLQDPIFCGSSAAETYNNINEKIGIN